MRRNHLPRFRRSAVTTLGAVLLATTFAAAAVAQESKTAVPPNPPAQLAVSPGRFEVEVSDRPSVQALKLMNFSDRDVTVKVSVVPWDLDENSRVRELETTEETLDQAMVFNPREFTVSARSEQTVRFSIRPRMRPAAGEHRAMLYFTEVPHEAVAGQLQVLFKVGVAVYAYAGEISRVAELGEVAVRSTEQVFNAVFDIESRGNAHVRMAGQYAIWPAEQFPGIDLVEPFEDIDRIDFRAPEPVLLAGHLPGTPVLPGTERQLILAAAHSLPAGDYVLSAVGTLGDREIRRAVAFEVPRAGAPIVAGQQD